MPRRFAAVVTLAAALAAASARADEVPEPSFDRIEYSAPQQYLALRPTMGSGRVLSRLAQAREQPPPFTELHGE